MIGKTNTPEFAFGPNTVNAVFGATRNPWNLTAHGRRVQRRIRGGAGHGHGARSPRAPTSAARSGAPRPTAGWSGSAPRPGSSRAIRRCSPGTPTRWRARWRAPSPTRALMLSVMAGPDERVADLLCRGHARVPALRCRRAVGEGLAHRVDAGSRRRWWWWTTEVARGLRGRPSASSAGQGREWRRPRPDMSRGAGDRAPHARAC